MHASGNELLFYVMYVCRAIQKNFLGKFWLPAGFLVDLRIARKGGVVAEVGFACCD